jgi:HSP20 family protein
MTRKHDWLPTMWSDWGEDEKSPFYALRKQIDTLIEDFDRGDLMKSGDFHVRTNVSETDTELRITAELPGIQRDDIDVEIAGDTITIKGEKVSEDEKTGDDDGREFHRLERRAGSFRRMTRLPFEIDPDKVVAEVKDGILTVTIPKPAEVRALPRKVEVKTAA